MRNMDSKYERYKYKIDISLGIKCSFLWIGERGILQFKGGGIPILDL
jgi:hypothetical protein